MYKTEQENFWKGTFGDDYVSRNTEDMLKWKNCFLE